MKLEDWKRLQRKRGKEPKSILNAPAFRLGRVPAHEQRDEFSLDDPAVRLLEVSGVEIHVDSRGKGTGRRPRRR